MSCVPGRSSERHAAIQVGLFYFTRSHAKLVQGCSSIATCRTFVSVDGLEVDHVSHDVIFIRDAVACHEDWKVETRLKRGKLRGTGGVPSHSKRTAKHVARNARNIERLATAVPLNERDEVRDKISVEGEVVYRSH